MQLPQLRHEPTCRDCGRHDGARSPMIAGEWMTSSRPPAPHTPVLVCLGTHSGEQEDRQGRTFAGPAGDILRNRILEASRLTGACTIYLLNAVRCWSPVKDLPKWSEYRACFHHTLADLETIQDAHGESPLFLLTLGEKANTSITFHLEGKKPSHKDCLAKQGRSVRIGEREWRLFTTYHPAFTFHAPNAIYAIGNHVELLFKAVHGRLPVPTEPTIVPARYPR